MKPERTDVREETLEVPRTQHCHKEPRHKTTAASQDGEDIRGVRLEGFRNGVREASNRNVRWIAENEELDLLERSTTSEKEEEPASITSNIKVRGAGYM
jgi:hypothetical protein